MPEKNNRPALPEKWIVPIRLFVYLVLAGCSAYIYFNTRDLEITHLFIFLPVAIIAGMALLDCRMSTEYWSSQNDGNKAVNTAEAESDK